MPNRILLLFVFLFWTGLWLFCKLDNLRKGKSFSDGPSLILIVLICSIVAIALGISLNYFMPWLGTMAIAVIHLIWVILSMYLIRKPDQNGKLSR
ncbi:hypothetical protein Pr1d_44420 [Bythopirellula goksoeyrii]|uniref:Uncharacterized protein n=1 Tax=Bythopirellula goksoeyrii TaxID=1400387 RepID=A0A5B9QHI0_9BACT|nr:hypothetical protein Pr1d_44420 [Bythopirellula goksoeyrii]